MGHGILTRCGGGGLGWGGGLPQLSHIWQEVAEHLPCGGCISSGGG